MWSTTRTSIAALLIGGGVMATAFAGANDSPAVGLDDAAVAAILADAGYELVEIEREDDEIEALATKDGVLWEVEIDPSSGAIVDAELEDDDEADDDKDDDDDKSDG